MTTDPRMSSILEDLAAGRIDAAEAARRIDALDTGEPTTVAGEPTTVEQTDSSEPSNEDLAADTGRPQYTTYPTDGFPAAEQAAADRPRPRPALNGVEKITVRAVGRRVRIIGESSVATLAADGPHLLRRNGSVLEVSSDGELGASLEGFSILKAPRNLDEFRSLSLGKELFLRVNPAIEVDVEVTGGSLHTERVPHLGKVRLTAGAAKLLDVEQVADALIQAGQATIKGRITRGRSRVRAESGSLSIHLADDSNVTVHGESQLGRVSWSGGHTGAGDEVVMGSGNGRLDVEVVMGYALVKVGSEQPEDARP